MWGRLGRAGADRLRQSWPTAVAVAVVFIASEILDDENGDKSATAWIVSGLLGLAVLLVVTWVRNDPSAGHEDERPHHR